MCSFKALSVAPRQLFRNIRRYSCSMRVGARRATASVVWKSEFAWPLPAELSAVADDLFDGSEAFHISSSKTQVSAVIGLRRKAHQPFHPFRHDGCLDILMSPHNAGMLALM